MSDQAPGGLGQRAWRFYIDENDTLWSIIRDEMPSLLDELHALKNAADANKIR